nr:hypothetical protein 4 [Gammaproteobacteria bacterium]
MSKKYERIKGRSSTKRFTAIPNDVLDSKAYSELGAWSVKLLVDIAKQYNGKNNGDLCAPWSMMNFIGWNSKSTLSDAKKQLVELGFLDLTLQGGKHKPSLYAITWKPIDECKGKHDARPTTIASNRWKEN